jgi:hypothetical protein
MVLAEAGLETFVLQGEPGALLLRLLVVLEVRGREVRKGRFTRCGCAFAPLCHTSEQERSPGTPGWWWAFQICGSPLMTMKL